MTAMARYCPGLLLLREQTPTAAAAQLRHHRQHQQQRRHQRWNSVRCYSCWRTTPRLPTSSSTSSALFSSRPVALASTTTGTTTTTINTSTIATICCYCCTAPGNIIEHAAAAAAVAAAKSRQERTISATTGEQLHQRGGCYTETRPRRPKVVTTTKRSTSTVEADAAEEKYTNATTTAAAAKKQQQDNEDDDNEPFEVRFLRHREQRKQKQEERYSRQGGQRRGKVVAVRDGVATVSGLDTVYTGAVVEFEHAAAERRTVMGLVTRLNRDHAYVFVLDANVDAVDAGDAVCFNATASLQQQDDDDLNARATGSSSQGNGLAVGACFPVGPATLGRVLNAVGEAVDGGPEIDKRTKGTLLHVPLRDVISLQQRHTAPSIVARAPLCEMMHTGIAHMDALSPVAHGSRTALIGCGRSGASAASSLAVDFIVNQGIMNKYSNAFHRRSPAAAAVAAKVDDDNRNREHVAGDGGSNAEEQLKSSHVVCVYVSIGRSEAEFGASLAYLRKTGALAYTTVIRATESEAVGLQFLAPFCGAAAAAFYRDRGMHALVVYDDLTAHQRVVAATAMASSDVPMLKNAAHEGPMVQSSPQLSVDSLHAALLERSAQMAHDRRSGSSTAIAVVCRLGSDVRMASDSERLLERMGGLQSSSIEGLVDRALRMEPYVDAGAFDVDVSAPVMQWPPLACGALSSTGAGARDGSAGNTSTMHFYPKLLKPYMLTIEKQLRESMARLKDMQEAAMLRIHVDEEDREVVEYAFKVKALLAQRRGAVVPLRVLLLSLHAASSNWLVELSLHDINEGRALHEWCDFVQRDRPSLWDSLRGEEIHLHDRHLSADVVFELEDAYEEFLHAFRRGVSAREQET